MARLPEYSRYRDCPISHEHDPLRFHYWPVLGRLYRRRIDGCVALLGSGRRVLDVGYGSGTSFLELGARFEEVHGLDTHDYGPSIASVFAREGLTERLEIARGHPVGGDIEIGDRLQDRRVVDVHQRAQGRRTQRRVVSGRGLMEDLHQDRYRGFRVDLRESLRRHHPQPRVFGREGQDPEPLADQRRGGGAQRADRGAANGRRGGPAQVEEHLEDRRLVRPRRQRLDRRDAELVGAASGDPGQDGDGARLLQAADRLDGRLRERRIVRAGQVEEIVDAARRPAQRQRRDQVRLHPRTVLVRPEILQGGENVPALSPSEPAYPGPAQVGRLAGQRIHEQRIQHGVLPQGQLPQEAG